MFKRLSKSKEEPAPLFTDADFSFRDIYLRFYLPLRVLSFPSFENILLLETLRRLLPSRAARINLALTILPSDRN